MLQYGFLLFLLYLRDGCKRKGGATLTSREQARKFLFKRATQQIKLPIPNKRLFAINVSNAVRRIV